MDIKNFQEKVAHVRSLLDPERIKKQKRIERSRGLAKGIAVGTLLGGLAGIFFAPDKGENTRKKTKEELNKAKEVLETNLQEGKGMFSEFVEDKKGIFNKTILVTDSSNSCEGQVKEDFFVEEDEEELELEKQEV